MNNTINCDLVLFPRFYDGWVVFDRWFYRNGKVIHKIIYDENAKKPCRKFPSFYFTTPINYIQCVDKKLFRKLSDFFDKEITGEEYNKRIKHLAIDVVRENIGVYKVNKVQFSEKLFICPISGIVWRGDGFVRPWPHYRKNHVDRPFYLKPYRNDGCSEILYITKRMREAFERFNFNSITGRDRGVKLRGCQKDVREAAMFGFLPTHYLMNWGGRRNVECPRDFIWRLFKKSDSLKVCKEDVIKSAARYIKKATRIAPLSESTKRFFKTLGALAHLKKAEQYATQP
jgi:hypothetical protein